VTFVPTRPEPPRRAASLVIPLIWMVVGFAMSAFLAALLGEVSTTLGGVVWGLAAASVMMLALGSAGVRFTPGESVMLAVAMVGSTMLTTIFLAQLPEALTPYLVLRFGAAWLIGGVIVGILVDRRSRPSTGVNVALIWAGAGVFAVPMAVSLGYLTPGSAVPGVTSLVVISILLALIGGGATLSAITGVRELGIAAVVLAITVFAGSQVEFSLIGLIENASRIANVPNFWPPDFSWAVGAGDWWWPPSWDYGSPTRSNPLLETFRIAILSSLIGCVVALPVAFMASTVTAANRVTYLASKGVMNVIRTVPELFWAMLFVAAVSVGPLAGVLGLIFFSLAIMTKLLSETIDSVDTGPLEAARATGGSHFPAVRVSVLPQVLPNYVAYALYIFELNVRASVVLGLVGAGGVGRVLEAQRSFFRFDRVLAVVMLIFVLVFVIEQISVAFRKRLV